MYSTNLDFMGAKEGLPFSFVYDGKPVSAIIAEWQEKTVTGKQKNDATKDTVTWTDPTTGLQVTLEVTKFSDYPAVEWVLWFENTGKSDTPVIEDIQALDLTIDSPVREFVPYRLHKTNGAPSNKTDFEVSTSIINKDRSEKMSGGGGRSSNKDFPFYKIDTGKGSLIVAVGWSGQWLSTIECPDNKNLHLKAGLEKTHFVLHPGEKVRSPRMLLFFWKGESIESNAHFRQLIYKHYSATRNGKPTQPILFCNTCFTRGGGWLNECNEENQISLIKAYAPMGLEALITDAGWFTGGWPDGAGNWDPRKDAYPNGMGPVAKAAKDNGMIYGLWFEPERVIAGTDIHKSHPEWILSTQDKHTHLLNFGLPEVQDYFFDIVKGFMGLPGFRFYRQDFNMDPLPYWLYNDAPDRQGIHEIKYIEGLYAYWDKIRAAWPDVIMEECASGGRRIDLETIQRMHTHQESDYWFDNETDQNQIWGLSQYLPNNLINTPLIYLDDYSFHSTMACSLIPGWIADDPIFDTERGKKLLHRYNELKHLLIGAWYPLLPYSRDSESWMASQYNRPDMDEGMVIVLRRPESPYPKAELKFRGLDSSATYELSYNISGVKKQIKGSELMKEFVIELPEKKSSELIFYRKVK